MPVPPATRSAWLVSLALVLLPGVEGRAADVVLETTRSEFQKIPIWIMGFGDGTAPPRSPATSGTVLADVLKADLQRTRFFEVVDRPAESLDLSQAHCRGRELIAKAGKSAASVVTWGRLGREDATLILDVCAHDAGGADVAVGKRYRGSPPSVTLLRRMVHRWADELVEHYTGEPGVAQTRIVYVAGNAPGKKALYVMDYDGFGSQRLTTTRHLSLMPTWLPDRRSVVYTTYRRNDQEIVQLDLFSKTMRVLVPSGILNITPALSPDGQVVAYASATEGNSDIFTVNVRTKEYTQLTVDDGADLSPAWSPDGRSLAFMSDRGGKPQIYIMDVDGAHVRRLTFDGSYNAAPAWSPRGDWIAYVCRVPRAGFRLCRISPDGRRRGRITGGAGWAIEDSPSWAPDGRRLVFSAMRGGRSHLYAIHVDGTGLEQLTRGTKHHSSPDWSPLQDRVVTR